jgi:hypothetical protein
MREATVPALPDLTVRLTHTGFHADGRPNPTAILLSDINIGADHQFRKHQVYIPSGASLDLPLTEWVMFSFLSGDIAGFIRSGQLDYKLPLTQTTVSWSTTTIDAGDAYVGGFYQFGPLDDDFAPAISFGAANQARSAHFFVVTGAVPTAPVTITVSGSKINDEGVSVASSTATITIPPNTPVNSYFETPEKWNGQVSIETTAGTPIACNYGMSKYHDHGNIDFDVEGLETLWASKSNDSTSDIALIHHKATGWTYNAGAEPDPPAPIASRSGDLGPNVAHVTGEQGAWKRTNLSVFVQGSGGEGVLWVITSASAGVGSQSFRTLNLELTINGCPLGICAL